MLQDVLAILAASVLAVAVFRRLRLPPVISYIAVGVALGPHVLGVLQDSETTHFLAEFGVVFLLFTVGLEFSLPYLLAMKGLVFGLGGSQVLVTLAVVGAAAWAAGLPPVAAFIAGAVFAVSSTAIVIKQLTEEVELNALHGRIAVGVLLFQDLAVIPFLVVITTVGAPEERSIAVALAWALVKGVAAFAALLAVGRWVLRPLFHEVAAARSAEIFTLTVLLVSLAAAWLTAEAGLSMALGGFLAGMMLSETEFRHQVEADIRPFRDILLGLFFITIGMMLNLGMLAARWYLVLGALAALVAVKTLIVTVLARLGRIPLPTALRAALVLAQGGEFGFALVALALSHRLLDPGAAQVILATVILSMALTPLLVRHNALTARLIGSLLPQDDGAVPAHGIEHAEQVPEGHVVICGFGRVGQNVARFLREENIPYVALDLDPARVVDARAAGEPVYYGDAAHGDVLGAAGLGRARLLLVSFDDAPATYRVLSAARGRRADLPILVRARDDANMQRMLDGGATEVVPEALEASLTLASHLLLLLNVPMERITRRVGEIRRGRYHLLTEFFPGQEPASVEAPVPPAGLRTVILPRGAHAVGRPLGSFGLQARGVEATALRRRGVRGDEPDPAVVLQEGDVLILHGAQDALQHAERLLLQGR